MIGADEFAVRDIVRTDPKFDRRLNSMPSSPSHVAPCETASIGRLAAFI